MAAVAIGHLVEVLLVVALGVVEGQALGRGHLGRDVAVPAFGNDSGVCRGRALDEVALLVGRVVDRTAVLRAGVIALAVALRRIVALPEVLEHVVRRDLVGAVGDHDGFGVTGAPGAHLLVCRMRGVATLVADGGGEDTWQAPVDLLRAPEAAHAEVDVLYAGGPGLDVEIADGRAQHGVIRGDLEGVVGAAGQRGLGGHHRGLGGGEEEGHRGSMPPARRGRR